MTKKRTRPESAPSPEPVVVRPTELLSLIRGASTLDAAIGVLQPEARKRFGPDTRFTLVEEHPDPLPQKRGACVKVYAAAARLDAPFRIADVEVLLPGVKSAAFWVRRLATLGFLKEA